MSMVLPDLCDLVWHWLTGGQIGGEDIDKLKAELYAVPEGGSADQLAAAYGIDETDPAWSDESTFHDFFAALPDMQSGGKGGAALPGAAPRARRALPTRSPATAGFGG